jgi:WD40 repeat protein
MVPGVVRGKQTRESTVRAARLVRASKMLSLALALSAGCEDATGPSTGTVRVSLTTTGADIDPDGYGVSVGGGPTRDVAPNGSVTFPTVQPGSHTVRLEGLAANCSADQGNERTVTVVAGQQVTATFTASCVALTGAIVVTTQTTGADPDPDGYTVSIDVGPGQPIGVNGTVAVGRLPARAHLVALNGVAPNCAVEGANPQTVNVTDETASASFTVRCVAAIGGLHVTTVTTGEDLDPDGFAVEVWTVGGWYDYPELVGAQPIGVNASVAFPSIQQGSYTVRLTGVASNCRVDTPQPAAVTVTFGGTTHIIFAVSCAATGTLQVTNTTSGPDLDPDGYALQIVGPTFSAGDSLPTNGSVTTAGLLPGTYRLTLTGIAENCAGVGAPARDVLVSSRATTTVALDVACAPATRVAFVSERDGNSEIYAVNSNGTGLTRLTSAAARDLDPAWSPDGQRIAFTSDRDGSADIYIMGADGSNVVRHAGAEGSNAQPTWSPDGRRIAFVSKRDGDAEIYVMTADGGSVPVRLTSSFGLDADPAWSPDGAKIAFTSARAGTRDLYVMNDDGSGVTRLTRGTSSGFEYSRPAWSPDGRRLAFLKYSCVYDFYYGSYCGSDVGIMNAAGSGERRLALSGDDETRPAWSPDGRTIAFAGNGCSGPRCAVSVVYARTEGSTAGVVELIAFDGRSPSWRR